MKTPYKPTNSGSGDLVLQELWRVKDEQSAARGHDIHRLFAEARQRQKHSNLPLVGQKPGRRKA